MKVPSWLGVIRQTAFVVDDIEREANHWVNFNGIGPWFLYNVDIADTTYRGETVRMKARMGLAQNNPGAVVGAISQLDKLCGLSPSRR